MSCTPYPSVAAATSTLFNSTTLRFYCISGYSLNGDDNNAYCTGGVWGTLPECIITYENQEANNVISVYDDIITADRMNN